MDTYIIPGFNGAVTLGGSRSYGSENTKLCPYESMAIRERCENFVPALKNAPVLRENVGLRPHRENNVRIEAEFIPSTFSKAIVSVKRILLHSLRDSISVNNVICITSWCTIMDTVDTVCALLLEQPSML